ncbi:MAG: hypothetical protein JWL70_2226 [Acidimicrobiia bacterium]|nr:hypothetical protein [Acidimicrobiia bacterium]
MNATTVVQLLLLVLVAGGGLAVVLERNPLNQSMVLGVFGLTLAMLFLALQAPDVALSEIVVGGFVVPTLVLVALAKAKDHQ